MNGLRLWLANREHRKSKVVGMFFWFMSLLLKEIVYNLWVWVLLLLIIPLSLHHRTFHDKWVVSVCVFLAVWFWHLHLCGRQLQWGDILECFPWSERCVTCAIEWNNAYKRDQRVGKLKATCNVMILQCSSNALVSQRVEGCWWSRTRMTTNFPARPPNPRSPTSPRTACPSPGSRVWLGGHRSPPTSSRPSGLSTK